MNCQAFRVQHQEFVDLALRDDVHDAMMQHRETCDACDHFDNAVRRGLMVVRNLPKLRLSTTFGSRLDAKLRAARLAETESQRAAMAPRPATVRTMLVAAASLFGMIYLAEPGAHGSNQADMTAAAAAMRSAASAAQAPRPMPRIYSAPLRSPAVVTVVSTASNAEWMSPTPGIPASPAFAPTVIETVAFVR